MQSANSRWLNWWKQLFDEENKIYLFIKFCKQTSVSCSSCCHIIYLFPGQLPQWRHGVTALANLHVSFVRFCTLKEWFNRKMSLKCFFPHICFSPHNGTGRYLRSTFKHHVAFNENQVSLTFSLSLLDVWTSPGHEKHTFCHCNETIIVYLLQVSKKVNGLFNYKWSKMFGTAS